MDIKSRIEFLREEIKRHDRLYEENRPEIADSEYDKLYLELEALERAHPEFYNPESPTQKITAYIVEGLEKVAHSKPMLSQEKITTKDGILKFCQKAPSNILVQHKLDGLTVVLTYENGKLKQAVTRGDGEIGENVTHTIQTVKNLPKRIPFLGKLEVRGEVIIPLKEFERLNVNGEYSNPRNLASGTVRQLDASIARERDLRVVIFDLVTIENKAFAFDSLQLEFLKHLGFEIVPYVIFENTEAGRQELVNYCESFNEKIRKTLPYMVDGLVLKFDCLTVREKLGNTAKYPRWSCAYKFKSLDATTRLERVVWQVGKSGQLTPVAEFKTVDIDGVKISRATLHNMDNIRAKDIRINDTIVIARANDVIPQVVQAIKHLRTGEEVPIEHPKNCPVCGSETYFYGANLYCKGKDCVPQLIGKLKHFASRNAMNIDGLGESTIETLVELGFLRSIADIYTLKEHKEAIVNLDGFGEKKFSKIVESVEQSKQNPLHRLIYGLSIKNIGQEAAKALAKEFGSMKNILEALNDLDDFKERLINIPDFGEVMANSIIEWFCADENRELINTLLNHGLTMEMEKTQASTRYKDLTGLTFVITGTLSKPREEFKAFIESLGGKVSGSVSTKTSYLINNDVNSTSTKNKKAKELGIPIISEEDFMKLITK